MLKPLKLILLFLLIVLFFTTCKKYPENTLWFRNPEKVLARGAKKPWLLEYYSVNDIDSTSSNYLDAFKELGVIIGDPYSSYGLYCEDIIKGGYRFSKKKKIISFGFAMNNFHSSSSTYPNYTNQRNIFLQSGQDWQILKLCSAQFWITTEFNNIKYELHFK